jgi:dipeptidyl aminopeptidase/acylaminoacyl peptidase
VWAALYRPAKLNPERAAVIHVHGGGYRQFAHRGWSVYGWGLHVGFLHHLLEAGYPVLDFDYRGGAGFGRDYRTDVAGAMGWQDVDGAVAAARYLVESLGVDSTRVGMYGVSYGGFMTLMSQFRHPGIFAACISRAPVTDWARDGTVALSELVKQEGMPTSYREIPGRHYWFLWRDFLAHYAQVAFQPSPKG